MILISPLHDAGLASDLDAFLYITADCLLNLEHETRFESSSSELKGLMQTFCLSSPLYLKSIADMLPTSLLT